MTYNYQSPPPARPVKKRRNKIAAIVSGALLGLLGLAVVLSVIGAVSERAKPVAAAPAGSDASAVAAPVAEPKATLPGKQDIRLTVKTTKKDCFGSAGCNIEYQIKAALSRDTSPAECDVTYDVHGLEDTQTGTLNMHSDGTYEQDSFQSGQTSSSSKKLTATVTDVDCS